MRNGLKIGRWRGVPGRRRVGESHAAQESAARRLWRTCMMRTAVSVLTVACLTAGVIENAYALPLQVRGQARLESRLETDGDTTKLAAQLTDESDAPIADASIYARFTDDIRLIGVTDTTGLVRWALDSKELSERYADSEDLEVEVRYEGSKDYSPVRQRERFELRRSPVSLTAVISPAHIQPGLTPKILFSLACEGRPLNNAAVQIKAGRETRIVQTGQDGRGQVRSLPALAPGRYPVIVHYEGNMRYASSVLQLELVVEVHAEFKEFGITFEKPTSQLHVAGQVVDKSGAALDGYLALIVAGVELGRAAVKDGRFDHAFDLENVPSAFESFSGTGSLEFQPTQDWVVPATFGPFPISIPAPERVTWFWYAALLLIVLCLPLLTRSDELQRPAITTQLAAPIEGGRSAAVEAGERVSLCGNGQNGHVVVLNFVSTLVPSSSVPCRLVVDATDASSASRLDCPTGRISLVLPPGEHTVQVEADGYLSQSILVQSPAAGMGLYGLVPFRSQLRQSFEALMKRVAPQWKFGRDSPQAAVHYVEVDEKADDVEGIANEFQELYFRGDRAFDLRQYESLYAAIREVSNTTGESP